MRTRYHKRLLASALTLTLLTVNATAADTAQAAIDARQQTQIQTVLALNPDLHANHIKVSVHNSTARLSGQVTENSNRELANRLALAVKGIKTIDNRIVIQPPHPAATLHGERSYGQIIDDATISTEIRSKLSWSKQRFVTSPSIKTRWGIVTLTGTVDSQSARNMAGLLAIDTKGALKVDNQLLINARPSSPGNPRAMDDNWITSKVKSTFMYSSDIDSANIAISTQNGMVILKGKVQNSIKRALAIELANNVRGVRGVNYDGLVI